MKIEIEIKTCEECPFHRALKVYTGDTFEDVREIQCRKLHNKVVHTLDWNEKSTVPDCCPFNKKKGKKR